MSLPILVLTALAGLLSALIVTLARARRAARGQAEILARCCHELRGPLTAVRLGLQLGARQGTLTPSRLEALDLELGRAGLALEDLERLRGQRAGEPPLRLEEVDVGGLVRAVGEGLRAHAALVDARIEVQAWDDGARVLADRLRLAQALTNLVVNALEHGGGTVQLGWRVLRGRVRIEVSDEGPGLPAPVSELAVRGERRARRGHGLAVAADVVRAHGGRLAGAPSERGARLVIELPAGEMRARAAGG